MKWKYAKPSITQRLLYENEFLIIKGFCGKRVFDRIVSTTSTRTDPGQYSDTAEGHWDPISGEKSLDILTSVPLLWCIAARNGIVICSDPIPGQQVRKSGVQLWLCYCISHR